MHSLPFSTTQRKLWWKIRDSRGLSKIAKDSLGEPCQMKHEDWTKAPFQHEEETQAIHLNGLIADFVMNADALPR
jgi:hypothetical protein